MRIEKLGTEKKCAFCNQIPTYKMVFDYGENKEVYLCKNGLESLKTKIDEALRNN